MEAGFEDLFPELLEFVKKQGKGTEPTASKDDVKDGDEAAEIVIQTVDDIVNGVSGQSLSTVCHFCYMYCNRVFTHFVIALAGASIYAH